MAKDKDVSFGGLAESLSKTMSKQFKGGVSIIQNTTTAQVTDWISTGCQMLDLAISNRPVGGFPCGRISVLYGPEQSGKSMFIAHAIADTQARGGIGIYIDAERALHEEYFNAIGVDTKSPDKWIHVIDNQLEVLLSFIEESIYEIRRRDKNVLVTIGLDSYVACVTEKDIAGDYSQTGYNTSKSQVMSSALPRLNKLIAQENICFIITNQVKYKMNVQSNFESPWRMPGGQSLPHYASVIIQLKKNKAIMYESNNIKRNVGRYGEAVIEKNRLGPPHIKVKFYIYYDRGVDNLSSYLDYMELFNIGKQAGAMLEYTTVDTTTGEEIKIREKGKSAFIAQLKRNPFVRDEIWTKICEKFIMAYSISSDMIDHSELEFEDDVDDEADNLINQSDE